MNNICGYNQRSRNVNASALKFTELSLLCEHFQGRRNVDKQLANFKTNVT